MIANTRVAISPLHIAPCAIAIALIGCGTTAGTSPAASLGGTSSVLPAGGSTASGGATTTIPQVTGAGGSTPLRTTTAGGTKATSSLSTSVGGTRTSTGGATSVAGNTAKGGTTATGTTGPSRGPTPATATAKFPFPQNRESSRCVYPTNYSNDDVQAIYTKWKADVVVADGTDRFRVRRPQEPGDLEVNSTVSEGIAYGMIIAVYMNDQPLFDGLWKYWLAHTWTYVPVGGGSGSATVLMNWYILSSGNPGSLKGKVSLGAATDADEDAAWALVMADRQWGGSGTLAKTYLQNAKDLLNDIWKYEVLDGKLIKNGSSWGDWKDLNISYFAPSEYRVFASATGNQGWLTGVVPTVYDTIDRNLTSTRKNQQNGLVPAWTQSDGTEIAPTDPSDTRPRHYQYDSCRTPFRIGLDACLFGDAKAAAYLAKTSSFFSNIGAANIVTGYNLDGTTRPEFSGKSSAFIGPAAVGAMHSATYQTFVNDAYGLIRQNNMNAGGLYYDESWAMMSILMMTGNYLDYTQY